MSLVSTDTSLLTAAGTPITDARCTASLDTTYDVPTQIAGSGLNAALYLNAFGSNTRGLGAGFADAPRHRRIGHPRVPHRDERCPGPHR